MSKDKNIKYNIKVRKKTDPQKVHQKKDFERVYKGYNTWVYSHPWYKTPFYHPKYRKITMYIILIFLVGYLVYLADKEEKTTDLPPSEKIEQNK